LYCYHQMPNDPDRRHGIEWIPRSVVSDLQSHLWIPAKARRLPPLADSIQRTPVKSSNFVRMDMTQFLNRQQDQAATRGTDLDFRWTHFRGVELLNALTLFWVKKRLGQGARGRRMAVIENSLFKSPMEITSADQSICTGTTSTSRFHEFETPLRMKCDRVLFSRWTLRGRTAQMSRRAFHHRGSHDQIGKYDALQWVRIAQINQRRKDSVNWWSCTVNSECANRINLRVEVSEPWINEQETDVPSWKWQELLRNPTSAIQQAPRTR
jgi:hypothetical protein